MTLKKLALQWLPCQAPGVIGSVLGLVGPVSVHCEVGSLICNLCLSMTACKIVQIGPGDTLACCWDVKQPTNISCPFSFCGGGCSISDFCIVFIWLCWCKWVPHNFCVWFAAFLNFVFGLLPVWIKIILIMIMPVSTVKTPIQCVSSHSTFQYGTNLTAHKSVEREMFCVHTHGEQMLRTSKCQRSFWRIQKHTDQGMQCFSHLRSPGVHK